MRNLIEVAKRELIAEGHPHEDEIDKCRLLEAALLRVADRHMDDVRVSLGEEMQLAEMAVKKNVYGPVARKRLV
jgi:hypothetical protein